MAKRFGAPNFMIFMVVRRATDAPPGDRRFGVSPSGRSPTKIRLVGGTGPLRALSHRLDRSWVVVFHDADDCPFGIRDGGSTWHRASPAAVRAPNDRPRPLIQAVRVR